MDSTSHKHMNASIVLVSVNELIWNNKFGVGHGNVINPNSLGRKNEIPPE